MEFVNSSLHHIILTKVVNSKDNKEKVNAQLLDTVMGPEFLKYFVISSTKLLGKLQLFFHFQLYPQKVWQLAL